MGVYVILDGVRREYPEAVRWKNNPDGVGVAILGVETHTLFSYQHNGQSLYQSRDTVIAQYGRYDLVGWMEEKE